MEKRGGGVKALRTKIVSPNLTAADASGKTRDGFLVLEVLIDVKDSMGANLVNSVCEGISPLVQSIAGGRVGLRILSNLCLERRAGASFSIPVSSLKTNMLDGRTVASRILEAYLFAAADPFRAATHNKGVMNGIDAVAIATGQDWRAINAAIYTSVYLGGCRPITRYSLETVAGVEHLRGEIEVPMSVGVKGGATQSNPLYPENLRILGNPSARELSQIIVCVGLAQNFAALRALSLEGIQKGHMKLHARNIAIGAGVSSQLVDEAVQYMIGQNNISSDAARDFIMQSYLKKSPP